MSSFINPEGGDGDVFKNGVAGGQKIQGGTGAGETLQLESTANASKGEVEVLDEFHFHKKGDIGRPGAFTGLDIGEGGSHNTDIAGVEIVEYWRFDDSAVSGSKFVRFASNGGTQLDQAGDAIYIGSKFKDSAIRLGVDTAMNPGANPVNLEYYNGASWVVASTACYEKDTLAPRENIHFENVETQYIEWDQDVDALMVAANNVLDSVPDSDLGSNMFWVRFINSGVLTTPMVFTSGKVRGTDIDFAGAERIAIWGRERARIPRFYPQGSLNVTTAAPASADIDLSANITLDGVKNQFNSGVDRQVFLQAVVPDFVDTSSKLELKIVGAPTTTNTGNIDFEITFCPYKVGDVKDGTLPETQQTISIAANGTADADQELPAFITIENVCINSKIAFRLKRLGSSDTFTGNWVMDGIELIYFNKFLV